MDSYEESLKAVFRGFFGQRGERLAEEYCGNWRTAPVPVPIYGSAPRKKVKHDLHRKR